MGKDTTSISEKLTSPLGRGLSSAGATAAALLAANKLMGSKKAGEAFARMGYSAPAVSNKGVAGSALASGGISALMADFDRSLYAKNLARKASRGATDLTRKEKKLLGSAVTKGPARGSKDFSEHYFSPTSQGAFRGILGGLVGGFSPVAAAEGALSGAGGTALNKAVLTSALRNRIESGKNLLPSERRLAEFLRRRNA